MAVTFLLEWTWPTGAKLPSENVLAKKFGVRRVSVREGAWILPSLGLLEIRPTIERLRTEGYSS